MTIPKKNSRSITIDDQQYRWVVSVRDNLLNLVVEATDDPGQRLQAYFQCRDLYVRGESGDWTYVAQKQSIRPSHVRRVVKAALKQGWQPNKKGGPFIVRDAANVAQTIDTEEIDYRRVEENAKKAYIKDIARDFLWTYMALTLCMDATMNDKLTNCEPTERIEIADDKMRQLGLTFCAFKDSFTSEGRMVVGLQCNEFPEIVEHFWWMFFG